MATKTKEQLSEKQAAGYFWRIFEFNAVPMVIWDTHGKISNANQAFLELMGYNRKEFDDGKINWRDLTPSEYLNLDEKCIQELKQKGVAEPFEKKYIRKDGTLVKVRLFNATLEPGEDQGIGIVMQVK